MADLLSVDDPDWIDFQSGDPAFLLRAAGEVIRRYCGWHIWPSVTVTVPKLVIGSAGIIMLPSLNVTDVIEVELEGSGGNDTLVDPDSYVWFRYGSVQLKSPPATYPRGFYGGYGYVPGGFLPGPSLSTASVTMTHGFDVVPAEIKQIGFELVAAAEEMPAGNVKDIQTPGFRLQFSQAPGMALNKTQMERLGAFRLGFAR